MIIAAPNERWSDLSAAQRAPLVFGEMIRLALLAAALVVTRRRPAQGSNGSKRLRSAVALVNFMDIGPIAHFAFGRECA